MSRFSPETEGEVISQTRDEVAEPPLYKVLLHNDDYTTMDFVVEVLTHVFHKAYEDAIRIMLNVHQNGVGVCGVYTYEIAETKVETIHELARERGFPLKSSLEKA
ncbi:MAG: ATP-dependent Clp protease adapter ClpS [Desulfobacterales bacterium CG23_combo_of_CG06-09_8_20_14_all_51_8]|nr:MAG: ATP-dependent Clp protease adapter ClpS [Desulfobacterales bacterium CG23_combo_of_CG06-09_8_20_14_all_51_8]